MKFKLFGLIWNFSWLRYIPRMLWFVWGVFSIAGWAVMISIGWKSILFYCVSTCIFASISASVEEWLTEIEQ